MHVTSVAQMSMAAQTQQLQYAVSAKVMQAASVTMMKESAAIAENTMDTLYDGMEDLLTGLGLGENVNLTV